MRVTVDASIDAIATLYKRRAHATYFCRFLPTVWMGRMRPRNIRLARGGAGLQPFTQQLCAVYGVPCHNLGSLVQYMDGSTQVHRINRAHALRPLALRSKRRKAGNKRARFRRVLRCESHVVSSQAAHAKP